MKTAFSVCVLALAAAAAQGGEALNLNAAALSLQPANTTPPTASASTTPAGRYGDAGTKWWTIGGGVASDFNAAADFNLHLAWSWFIVDRVEWGLEGGAWYFDQKGKDQFGASGHMLFRWHFWMSEDRKWSIFADAGIGLLGTSGDVPAGGTSFDFMPRVGAGVTREIAENTRLEAGIRWHHISNARINGDNDNPSRDGVMFYTGVIFPF